ncbi:MAG: N-acetylmuramoyl-L-alanine amidase [Aestuariivirga sp.]|nr:N-acetylmuramoyl-L-alanine amidase [Aestuariivirga sp.]
MLLLHYTGMTSAAAACEQLRGPESGVSCHYLIDEDGAITLMVGEEERAWHAGVSFWQGETDTNSRSIGIEVHNPGHSIGYRDFPAPQMQAVVALSRDILTRHAIPPRNVLAHSDVAPGRKIDPGERFDWPLLFRNGIGHWVPPAAADERQLAGRELAAFQGLLKEYGYAVGVTGELDEATRRATDAFQRHFRPALVNGIPDVSALRTAERLAR